MSRSAAVWLGMAAILLAFVVGSLLFGELDRYSAAQQERVFIENRDLEERLEREQGARVFWTYAQYVLVFVVVLAAVVVGWAWGMRRALTVPAGDNGLFPVVYRPTMWRDEEGRRQWGWRVYNFNRALGASALEVGGTTRALLPAGFEQEQLAVTMGALAVQGTAARYRHAPVGRGIRDWGLGIGDGGETPALGPSTGSGWEGGEVEWPDRIPLRAVVDGRGSYRRLGLGLVYDEAAGQFVPLTGGLEEMSHILVGGGSGWGKSNFLRMFVFQLARSVLPVRLALVDLEASCLGPFAQSERLLWPIAENEEMTIAVLRALMDEVERRKVLYGEFVGVDRLDLYNVQAERHGAEVLDPIALVVDEATALLADRAVEASLRPVVLRTRKYGIYVVLAGQDIRGASIDKAISNQLSTRLCFYVPSASQSRAVVLQSGAEELDAAGRALVLLPGRRVVKMQAPVIGSNEIAAGLAGQVGPREGPPSPPLNPPRGGEVTGVSEEEAAEIRRLRAEDVSLSEIARRVFGVAGGAAFYKVREVLDIRD